MTRTPALVVLLDGARAGEVHQDRNGRLQFIYADAWRRDRNSFPLSLSMPLTASEHAHDTINAFLWGLLPDNARTLDLYGLRFGVSPGNAVALLAHLGPDCAGSVQLARPDRADELIAGSRTGKAVDWLTTAEIAAELRTLREQGLPGAGGPPAGRFSLSGAQPKVALLEEGGRFGRPGGRAPTNVILKPPSREFAGFAENEHFCLELATALGLGAVRSRVMRFGSEVAIVVSRFDRQRQGRAWRRVHQEDACQALGVMPTRKYQSEGGPGAREIVTLLRDGSDDAESDVARFVAALGLNWIIAATDGHAKNYAFLHGRGRACRLAPLYDIASFLPYADARLHRVKLAMKIGPEYLVRRIVRADWVAFAKSIGTPPALLVDRLAALSDEVGFAVHNVAGAAIEAGLDPGIINSLAARISVRARDSANVLAHRGATASGNSL